MDFVATVFSSWHLIVLYSFLGDLQQSLNRDIKGIVYIRKYNNFYRISEKNFFDIKNVSIQYEFVDSEKTTYKSFFKYLSIQKNDEHDLYVISPYWYDFKTNPLNGEKRNINFIALDEGLGSYQSRIRFLLLVHSPSRQFSFRAFIYIILTELIKEFMKLCLKLKGASFKKYFLYKKQFNKLKINKNVANNLKDYFEARIINREYKNSCCLLIKDLDKDYLGKNDSMSLMQKLISLVPKDMDILLKIHPAEINSDYLLDITNLRPGISILKTDLSAEEVFVLYRPKCVLSGFSTSGFVINTLFDSKIINYINLYKNYKITNPYYLKKIREFKNLFSDFENIEFLSGEK